MHHIEAEVRQSLITWEPRIDVLDVDVRAENLTGKARGEGRLTINILYEEKATRDERTLVFPFYLIPDETS